MEDIIEEIVGEIHDEYDDEERTYTVINDHTWVFEAKTQLTDFYKITKVDEDDFDKVDGDADTLAGLLLEIKGEFPALHEKVLYHRYEFEVLAMDSRRILKVKFTVNEPSTEEEASRYQLLPWLCYGNIKKLLISGESGKQKSPRKNFWHCCPIRKDMSNS